MDDIQNQLSQMKTLLEHAPEDDKPGIQAIIDQLHELLGVYTSESSTSNEANKKSESEEQHRSQCGSDASDPDDEYKLFQAEIAAISSENTTEVAEIPKHGSTAQDNNSVEDTSRGAAIENDLEDLVGMKCVAPHQENWGQIGYHNAMIAGVLSLEQGDNEDEPNDLSAILVRVIFLQPVVNSQLFCPFYKEDRCKFSDNDCKFSHGEVVPLSQLREYIEPDYSSIVPGSRVLAKYNDDLWYKATVQRITEDGECEVSYDVGNESLVIPLHETTPLDNDAGSSDSSLSEEDDIENPPLSSDSEDEIPKSLSAGEALLDIKGDSALGVWEKHTKGFGSKLMMKMGYIMGTGLGRHREGRVEPVDAIVLPPGKSLDACMALKEKAKDGNLFSAEKRRLKLQRKADKQRLKLAAQKPKEEPSVFEFLNSKLTIRKTNTSTEKDSAELRKQSRSNLNKSLFGVNENIRQVNKDIAKTKESMKRHKGKDKGTYSVMEKKLEMLENKRRELDSLQNGITKEQKIRSDKRKLDIF